MFHNLRRFWVLSVGLLAYCSPGLCSADSILATDAFNQYTSLGSYYIRYRDQYVTNVPLRLPLSTMPAQSPSDCFVYATVFGYGGIDCGAFIYPPSYIVPLDPSGVMDTNGVYPDRLAYLSAISQFNDGYVPMQLLPSTLCESFNSWDRSFTLTLDPASFYAGTIATIFPTLYNVGPQQPGATCYSNITRRVISRNAYLSRAYVLPQRVRYTNDWNGIAPLWDMYGDGRMFIPRIIFDGGSFSRYNISQFDASLWEQLIFNSMPVQSAEIDVYRSSITALFYADPPDSAFQSISSGQGWNISGSAFRYRVRNERYEAPNLIDPTQYPYMSELFGFSRPSPAYPESWWGNYRYIPSSIQRGDMGRFPYTAGVTNSKREGITGIMMRPVSSPNGAYLRLRRFWFVPSSTENPDSPNTAVGILILYQPGGIAWDSSGGLVFDWLPAGKPVSAITQWPFTSCWDFEYWIMITRPIGPYIAPGQFPTYPTNYIACGPNSTPPPQVPPVQGLPFVRNGGGGGGGAGGRAGPSGLEQDPIPPVPSSPSGGGSGTGFQSSGIQTGTVGLGHGFGSGLRPGYISVETGDVSSSVKYSEENTTVYPVNDSGDLVGDYSISFPGYSDIKYYPDFVPLPDEQAIDDIYGYSVMWISYDHAITDFEETGAPVGSFGHSVRNANMSQHGEFFGSWNSSGSWYYQLWGAESILPSIPYLVIPWPEHTIEGWDWEATRQFPIPELFSTVRSFLLVFVLAGESAYFLVVVFRMFQGGN